MVLALAGDSTITRLPPPAAALRAGRTTALGAEALGAALGVVAFLAAVLGILSLLLSPWPGGTSGRGAAPPVRRAPAPAAPRVPARAPPRPPAPPRRRGARSSSG